MNIEGNLWPFYFAINWGSDLKWIAGISFYGDWWRCSYFETDCPYGRCTSGFYRSIGPFFIERESVRLKEQSPGSESERNKQ